MRVLPSQGAPRAPVTVMLVGEHPITLHGVRIVLGRAGGFEIVGEARHPDEAFRMAGSLRPRVVTVDVGRHEEVAIELTARLASAMPEIATLILSGDDEPICAERALIAGARGFVFKRDASEELVAAVRLVLSGDIYMTEPVKERLADRIAGRLGRDCLLADDLSPRERQVLGMTGEGLAIAEIAKKLKISVATVSSYRESIRAKLHLRTRSELLRHAIRWARAQAGLPNSESPVGPTPSPRSAPNAFHVPTVSRGFHSAHEKGGVGKQRDPSARQMASGR